MKYLLDYLREQLHSFQEVPFGSVDAAALSQITMLKMPNLVPPLLERSDFTDSTNLLNEVPSTLHDPVPFTALLHTECFNQMFDGAPPHSDRELNLYGVASSPRFRSLRVGEYLSVFDKVHEVQFAAMTFSGSDFGVVSFRGTDSTLTGWKEDCNMSFMAPVPAQTQARQYLEDVAERLPHDLYVIGHSKGGNLAEYATLTANQSIQKRIRRTYNLDGPGFKEGLFNAADYHPVIDRIHKVVPVNDIVGILLFSPVALHPTPSSAQGFGAHSVFTWEVDESLNGEFTAAPSISPEAKFMQTALTQWLANTDDAKREQLVEALFRILRNGPTVGALLGSGLPGIATLLQKSAPTDPKDVATVVSAGQTFANSAADVMQASLDPKPPTKS